MLVDEKKDPETYRYFHDRNLLRQFDFLEDCVKLALKDGSHYPDDKLLKNLNQAAVANLSNYAGEHRPHDVQINNSPHLPPSHREVGNLVHQFLQDVKKYWSRDAVWLAAFCLWRINWIHPFAEGNGRTARAVSYFVLCVKLGMWLPGNRIILQQIRDNREPYYKALRDADDAFKKKEIDVSSLERYLEGLLKIQLTDVPG